MQTRRAILDQLAQSRDRQNELQSLQERAAAAADVITSKWSALEAPITHSGESLPILLRMAESFVKERTSERRKKEDLHRQLKGLSEKKRRDRVEDCRRRMSLWSQIWAPHVEALRLPDSSTPDRMARALIVLENVFHQLDQANSLQYRVKRIGDNIETFENRVSKLVSALDPSCQSLSPDAAIRRLHLHFMELGNAETERKTLVEQNEKASAMVSACRERTQQASATLKRLRALANCEDDEELERIVATSEEKSDKKEEYERIAARLIERNATADLAQIEQEASAYDFDSLRSEIAGKADRLKTSVDDISQAASRHGELTNEFERLETSEESVLQAQKAEDALAQLRPALQQYLRLRLASEVLQQAIESYREKHQGPILARVSALFSRLTLGAHSGLTSDFGNDDKPVLAAIRRNGERLHIQGLSDGTRDQLYLALRLAAIEDHVARVASCPVVFDDLLINSDDTRASAALLVIAELARHTQVLFFTHHRRLADLGIEAGAQAIELASVAAAATA